MDQKKGQAIADVRDRYSRHRHAVHRRLEQPGLDVADQEREARRCWPVRVPGNEVTYSNEQIYISNVERKKHGWRRNRFKRSRSNSDSFD